MNILGINAYHGDAAAALLVDGTLVAAAEEERFNRTKHAAGFPLASVRSCLHEAGIDAGDVDHVAVSRDPSANLHRKVLFTLSKGPRLGLVKDRLANAARMLDVRRALIEGLGVPDADVRARFHRVEHHRAHVASAFLASPFERAACLSIDGFGDFASALMAVGEGTRIRPLERVLFPHSVGILYTAITQYLGFPRYGDEYKVMGLAPYGEPSYLEDLRSVLRAGSRGYELDLRYFVHHSDGVAMTWDGGEPVLGRVWSNALAERFGPARQPGTPIERRHENMAASLQAVTEEAIFALLRGLHEDAGSPALCLAGGVAFNSVANGKILDRTPFRELYIQPAAGDAGTALGAALHVWHEVLGKPRGFAMEHAYWGPAADRSSIEHAIEGCRGRLEESGTRIDLVQEEEELCRRTARMLAGGKVVGWFQGRMEWGPRALGARSILADPRRADMKDRINKIIKKREAFRPFCPSILAERTGEYFETSDPAPYMLRVHVVRPEKRGDLAAVTHVDGTGRLQTVTRAQNPRYHALLRAFDELTSVPVLLNTSFNENEPIVCRPEEALDCFLRTRMDALVLGDHVLERPSRP